MDNFDHVGGLHVLLQHWQVPVYAHPLEIPYLIGTSSYPPADPTVGGGMMSWMSWMYPTSPIDIQSHVRPISKDNEIPGLKGWHVVETPGHSPGHISLYRENDGVLLAGDAVVTTQQESALNALLYFKKISGPPKYMTCNWASAKISVLKLSALSPSILATGHGQPMEGEAMRKALEDVANHFDKIAVPKHGRYVNEPVVADEHGVRYIPPKQIPSLAKVIGISAAVLAIGVLLLSSYRKHQRLAWLRAKR